MSLQVRIQDLKLGGGGGGGGGKWIGKFENRGGGYYLFYTGKP